MNKRGSGEVAGKILSVLSNAGKSMTIQEISKASGVNWESTKRYLEVFVKTEILHENKEEGTYQKVRSFKSDTWFSIPLSEEHRAIIRKVYATIQNKWGLVSDKPLSKTLAQKIAVDVVEKQYPKIPRGWYLYGEILLLPFESDQQYGDELEKAEDIETVKAVCMEYSPFCGDPHQIMRHQYEKRGKQLYLVKEKLMDCIACTDFSSSAELNRLRELLNEFAIKCERRENNAAMLALADAFCADALFLLRNSEKENLDKARPAMIEAFDIIWRLVATQEFYHSLSAFVDKSILSDCLGETIRSLEELAPESLESLESFRPKPADDEIARKLRALMGSAKELTSEEKEKRVAEMNEIKRKFGDRELDKFLSKKLGLDF